MWLLFAECHPRSFGPLQLRGYKFGGQHPQQPVPAAGEVRAGVRRGRTQGAGSSQRGAPQGWVQGKLLSLIHRSLDLLPSPGTNYTSPRCISLGGKFGELATVVEGEGRGSDLCCILVGGILSRIHFFRSVGDEGRIERTLEELIEEYNPIKPKFILCGLP